MSSIAKHSKSRNESQNNQERHFTIHVYSVQATRSVSLTIFPQKYNVPSKIKCHYVSIDFYFKYVYIT